MKALQSYVIAFVLSLAFFGVIFGLSAVSLSTPTEVGQAVAFQVEGSRIDVQWFQREFYMDFSFLPDIATVQERGWLTLYSLSPPPVRLLYHFIEGYGADAKGLLAIASQRAMDYFPLVDKPTAPTS